MKTKQEVIDRMREMEKKAREVGDTAARHERAKQGAERLQLQVDCGNAGGHVYEDLFGGLMPGAAKHCRFCGRDESADAQQLARNLGTVFTARA